MGSGWPFIWGRRTYVMGIVNVTPDSFSGDGIERNPERAAQLAGTQREEGADIVDVGGESTRPGHKPVCEQEERARVIPVIDAIRRLEPIAVSVDTSKASVAKAALEIGAHVVNDVTGLEGDEGMMEVIAATGAGIVIMHGRRERRHPNLIDEVLDFFDQTVADATRNGIDRSQIVIDPGFGFGKDTEDNLELLRRLRELGVFGLPVLVGMSRKSTIGKVLGLPVEERLEGTLATVALAIAGGADIVRVHDVQSAVRVCRMTDAVVRG